MFCFCLNQQDSKINDYRKSSKKKSQKQSHNYTTENRNQTQIIVTNSIDGILHKNLSYIQERKDM